MTLETNKNRAFVQEFIEAVFNTGSTETLTDYFMPGSLLVGGFAGQLMVMRTGFPDLHFTVEEMVAEADKVVVRLTFHATNSGMMLGLPAFGRLEIPVSPTGKPITGTAIYIFTLRDGKIVSMVSELDQIALLQQMGWTIKPPDQATQT